MIRPYLCRMVDSALGRHIHRRLEELRSLEYCNQEQVAQVQQEKLQALLLGAYEHVPYYRQILGEKKVADSQGRIHLDRFTDIPFLTKDILRGRGEDLKTDDLKNRKWDFNHSGGSTGEPVQFIQDQEYHDHLVAVKDFFDIWSGCPPVHKKVILWGSMKDLHVDQITWRIKFSRWLRNHLWLNAFKMTSEDMDNYVEHLNKFKPDQILGYVESLYELSFYIKSKNIPIFTPKAIMTSAGTLFPHMKTVIEETFAAPVFNRYGSREVGDMACECEKHNGLHISPMTHYIEIVRPDGTPASFGEEGEIVVTLLTNHSMPLIRYKIGDRGVLSSRLCPCQRNWPMLEKVSGRISDSFVRRDGGLVSSEYFGFFFWTLFQKNVVRRYQVIQEDYEVVRVRMVLSPGLDSQENLPVDELRDNIKLLMGDGCKVIFEIVEEIVPSASGKHRYVFSLIHKESDAN
jgi:phenylacetate-CoA ligase